ncbi:MAG: hypothetical protein PHO83_14445, partial [Geobacteraceae bacterium]|nr:hypothetical protein [Geobacteraceae bacterium]
MILVQHRLADHLPLFLLQRKIGDGAGGTNLSAESAVILAVAESGDDKVLLPQVRIAAVLEGYGRHRD